MVRRTFIVISLLILVALGTAAYAILRRVSQDVWLNDAVVQLKQLHAAAVTYRNEFKEAPTSGFGPVYANYVPAELLLTHRSSQTLADISVGGLSIEEFQALEQSAAQDLLESLRQEGGPWERVGDFWLMRDVWPASPGLVVGVSVESPVEAEARVVVYSDNHTARVNGTEWLDEQNRLRSERGLQTMRLPDRPAP